VARHLKRLFDRSAALAALVLLSPLLALVAIAVRAGLGSPVIFSQSRGGLHGRKFEIFKFRTMTDARDAAGHLQSDAARLTRLGRFLRSTSLDELPSLWNIVRGEMSLVGPRPLLASYLGRYRSNHARRHEVLPGLTGWAQINGRNDLPFSKRFDLDIWYVDNWSLSLDLKILIATFARVLRRRGIGNDADFTQIDDVGLIDRRRAA
jgi:sugar transferase EpsL